MKKLLLSAALLGIAGPGLADDRLRTFHTLKLAKAGVPIALSAPALARYGQLDVSPSGGVRTSVRPILAYDSNLNGGVPHKTVDINGIEFTVQEQDRAVAGLEVGGMAAISGQYLLSRGHRLSGSASLRHEQALAHDISTSILSANACYHYDSPSWAYGEACVSAGHTREALSETNSRSARITFGKVLDLGRLPIALEVGVSRTRSNDDDYDQLHAAYKINTSHMTFELGGSAQLRASGFAEDQSIHMAMTRQILGRPVTARLRHSRSSGGNFLGLAREEQKTSASLSIPVTKDLSLDVSYAQTASPLEYFRKRELAANFSWRQF